MQVISLTDAPVFEPAGHAGVVNRLLAGETLQGQRDVSVWHGTFAAGGRAEPHVHESSTQVYVALDGSFVVGDGDQEFELAAGSAVVIAAGESHMIENRSGHPSTVLVISAPALR